MIKEIRLLNVKGVTGLFNLAPITVITGRNSVGKTAILDAVQLSLLGYVPALGKQNQSTMALASGTRMAVAVGDQTWSWELKKTKVQATLPDGFVPAPETMLDLSGLFSLTKEQRVLAVMRACHLPDSLGTTNLVEKVRVACPSFPFPAVTGKILEDVEAMTKAAKTFQSTTRERLAEYEAAAARHADEMAAIPTEPKSLEPEIGAASEKLGIARQKLKQARDSEGERAKTLAKANAMTIPDAETLKAEKAQLEAHIATFPVVDTEALLEAHNRVYKPRSEKLGEIRGYFKLLKERLTALTGKQECPTCGHAITGSDHDKIHADLDRYKSEGLALSAELESLQNEFNAANQKAVADETKRQAIRKRITIIEAQLASIPELEKAKANLLDTIRSLPAPEEEQALQAEVDSLSAQITALQARQRQYQAAQALLIAAEQAAKHRREYEARVDQVKLAISLIADFRGEVLKMVAETLLNVANRVIEPCLGRKLALEEGDFTLDRASMMTLSGSERMVVYAGLQIALSAAHKPKIVLMDELGVIDPVRKAALFKVIEGLIADGTISQFIGVDINPLESLATVAGVGVVRL